MSRLGPVEVCCDAPGDLVVRACEHIGFRSPWDVRWLRLSRLPQRPPTARRPFRLWRWLRRLVLGRPQERTCTCGQPLPRLRLFLVGSMPAGRLSGYRLGQCPRCFTIIWDEA